jgi:CRP-like cAMP-binding protein
MNTTADLIKALSAPYREGERIVNAGEVGVCLFLVQSGSVRLSRRAAAGLAPLEIAVLRKGDIFGEGALLDGRPYGVDAEAISDCEVLELSAATFEKLLRAHPEIGVRLLRQLAGRLGALEERLTAAAPEGKAPASGALPAGGGKTAQLIMDDGAVVFTLAGPDMLIGRYDPVTEIRPEIDLSPVDVKRSVSRRHAHLTEKSGAWWLSEESGVLNGTFVNGIKLTAGRPTPLADGDVVSLGMVRLVFREHE